MRTVTVRLNDKEQKIFEQYARLHGQPLSTLLKRVFEERIEDELDLKVISEYEENIKKNDIETFDHIELKKC